MQRSALSARVALNQSHRLLNIQTRWNSNDAPTSGNVAAAAVPPRPRRSIPLATNLGGITIGNTTGVSLSQRLAQRRTQPAGEPRGSAPAPAQVTPAKQTPQAQALDVPSQEDFSMPSVMNIRKTPRRSLQGVISPASPASLVADSEDSGVSHQPIDPNETAGERYKRKQAQTLAKQAAQQQDRAARLEAVSDEQEGVPLPKTVQLDQPGRRNNNNNNSNNQNGNRNGNNNGNQNNNRTNNRTNNNTGQQRRPQDASNKQGAKLSGANKPGVNKPGAAAQGRARGPPRAGGNNSLRPKRFNPSDSPEYQKRRERANARKTKGPLIAGRDGPGKAPSANLLSFLPSKVSLGSPSLSLLFGTASRATEVAARRAKDRVASKAVTNTSPVSGSIVRQGGRMSPRLARIRAAGDYSAFLPDKSMSFRVDKMRPIDLAKFSMLRVRGSSVRARKRALAVVDRIVPKVGNEPRIEI